MSDDRPPLTLDEAIGLLVDAHTRDEDEPLSYSMIAGARPQDRCWHSDWHLDRYAEAWGVLRAYRKRPGTTSLRRLARVYIANDLWAKGWGETGFRFPINHHVVTATATENGCVDVVVQGPHFPPVEEGKQPPLVTAEVHIDLLAGRRTWQWVGEQGLIGPPLPYE